MRLFSYCIPVDDGAAPNPFWGICTLTICKPRIRKVAEEGDWIAGVGSVSMGQEGKLVYAMQVTEVLSLAEYDHYCRTQLVNKIPDIRHSDYRRRLGDCIYDYSNGGEPLLRPGVHGEANRDRDIGGVNALLSDHFYYFGNHAKKIPNRLTSIIKQGQGHKSNSNESVKHNFVEWIESLGYAPNVLHGDPQFSVTFSDNSPCACGTIRAACHDEDEVISNSEC
jgi:hypothetical protein